MKQARAQRASRTLIRDLEPPALVFLYHRRAKSGDDRLSECALKMSAIKFDRAISTGKLNALPRLHTRPINVMVYHGS